MSDQIFTEAGVAERPIDPAVLEALMRETVALKYSPDQPRDWRGRWSDELHDDVAEGKVAWAGGSQHRLLRSALADGRDPRRYQSAREARALLIAANGAPPTSVPLYRGIRVNAWEEDRLRGLVGSTVDMNLSSWTDHEGNAQEWAIGSFGQQSTGEQSLSVRAVFALAPGAHALDISDITNQIHSEGGYYHFTEMLTAGRFRVTSVDSWRDSFGYPRRDTVRVGLEQVATLKAPDLVYTKVDR